MKTIDEILIVIIGAVMLGGLLTSINKDRIKSDEKPLSIGCMALIAIVIVIFWIALNNLY